jgi:uncharacterized protein (DUF924 family)
MEDILEFWFRTLQPSDWYKKSDELDEQIKERFEPVYRQVVAGETSDWRGTPEGRLAEIIVLDQFSRNMFRGSPESFVADPLALALAQEAVRNGDDQKLEMRQRVFVYMPYMHSESARVHEQAMDLFADTPNLEYEIKHKAIIDRFGRYPHRNDVLGRESTAEELEWMKTNSGF